MYPYLGAGAGQGVEDAYLLAHLIADPQTTANNVEARVPPCHPHKLLSVYISS